MKIKVGNQCFDCDVDQPIMVVLTDQDKENIANMLPECTKYALFHDDWGSKEEMLNWMNYGP